MSRTKFALKKSQIEPTLEYKVNQDFDRPKLGRLKSKKDRICDEIHISAMSKRISNVSFSSQSSEHREHRRASLIGRETLLLRGHDFSKRLESSMFDENSSDEEITVSLDKLHGQLASSKSDKEEEYKRPWFIILPSNKYRLAWDMVMAWVLIVMAFYVPFRVCLYWDDDGKPSPGVFWFEVVIDSLFGVDIILNFITAYQDDMPKTSYVCNPRKIAMNYMKGFFWIDVLATFPFGYIITSSSSLGPAGKIGKLGKLPRMMRFLKAVRLLKLLRVYKMKKVLYQLEAEFNIHHGVTRMIKIISAVVVVTHLSGCFWYLVGLVGGDDLHEGGWVFRYSYHHKSIHQRYIASLYWALSTLTTVGYGDISARTPAEQIYSMITFLLGVSWYAFVVSSINQVMSSFDSSSSAAREKMVCVNQFIRGAQLPTGLGKKVRDHFEYRLAHQQKIFLMKNRFEAEEILTQLSSQLRAEIYMWMDQETVDSIPFFHDKSPQFVADALHLLQPMVFHKNENIVKEGSQADEMFFLTKGQLAIYYGERLIVKLEEGSYFGEIGCLVGGIRRASVRAMMTCELFALSRRDLFTLITDYPGIEEELRSVASNRDKIARKDKADEERRRSTMTIDRTLKNAILIHPSIIEEGRKG